MQAPLFRFTLTSRSAFRLKVWATRMALAEWERTRKTSVLDPQCKAHDLDNLYVVDASCFVSASAVNPSLTIIANAIRIADHLLAECIK